MGLTTSMFTGLSGLTTNANLIAVSGNNIANVNTTGFKASRYNFETQIVQTLRSGSGPGDQLGGTNPLQIGLGARDGSITRSFTNGSIQPTGVSSHLAIEGNGFFVVDVNGNQQYTRAGNFGLDRDFFLTDAGSGGRIQGYTVDNQFRVIEGVLTDINIPLGVQTLAEASTRAQFSGNLNASGAVATRGSINTSDGLVTAGGAPINGSEALTALRNPADLTTPLFAVNDVITLSGITKGGAELPTRTFQVGAANTTQSNGNGTNLSDFLTFLDQVLGLDTAADPAAGIVVDPATGQLVVTGNSGFEANNIVLTGANIVVNAGSSNPTTPFEWTQTQEADGESVRTGFTAFDSLGSAMTIELTAVLEEKTNGGTVWRVYIQSDDNSTATSADRVLATSLLTFDTNGRLTSDDDITFTINRNNTGAATPQAITASFVNPKGSLSSLEDTNSLLTNFARDGAPIGTLEDFSVQQNGVIVGVFTNGLVRNLGQVVLAQFSNPQGLQEIGGNFFVTTPNSGTAQIVTAGTGGSGRIVGGALEGSNVDLTQEFISLISAQTGFSAASRVLTTANQLIQELLLAAR
jgi:flagellar hook protein FlgE